MILETVFDKTSDYCYIIAEAGSNHEGKLEVAKKLVDVAVEAKADAVKFQLFTADKIASAFDHPTVRLSGKFEKFGKTAHDLFKNYEFNPEWLSTLIPYCKSKGIEFMATPFDETSADLLEKNGVSSYKIASFEITHLPLLKHIAKFKKPMIISTGMASLSDIEEAVATMEAAGNSQIIILHCGIEYPPRYEDVNLRAMNTIATAFPYPIGYSDHTPGSLVPIAAVARGARIIEKHFTIDKFLPGPDHSFSLDAKELVEMVSDIRKTTMGLGSPRKQRVAAEEVYYLRGRRSIFAKKDIPVGAKVTLDMVSVLRPGIGLSPKFLDVIVGRTVVKAIKKDDPITWENV